MSLVRCRPACGISRSRALVARRSRRADVVYATSMVGRTSLVVRAPLVVKVAGDPAFERAPRRGFYSGTLDAFQTAALEHRGCGAAALADAHGATGGAPLLSERVSARHRHLVGHRSRARVRAAEPDAAAAEPARRATSSVSRSASTGPLLAFAGRLTRAKALDVLSDAVERVEGVTSSWRGTARSVPLLRGDRIRLLGCSAARASVLELLAAADAVVLSSTWENFPHVLVEALSSARR